MYTGLFLLHMTLRLMLFQLWKTAWMPCIGLYNDAETDIDLSNQCL